MTDEKAPTVHVLHKNPYWSYCVRDQDTKHPYFYIDVPKSVLVVAKTAGEHVLLVEQDRPALGQLVTEFPGGGVAPDETIAHAARRELLEEAGIDFSGTFLQYAVLAPSTGCSSELCFVMLAAPVNSAAAKPEDGLRLRWVSYSEVRRTLLGSPVLDAVAVAAWSIIEAGVLL